MNDVNDLVDRALHGGPVLERAEVIKRLHSTYPGDAEALVEWIRERLDITDDDLEQPYALELPARTMGALIASLDAIVHRIPVSAAASATIAAAAVTDVAVVRGFRETLAQLVDERAAGAKGDAMPRNSLLGHRREWEEVESLRARWLRIRSQVENTPPNVEFPRDVVKEAVEVSRLADRLRARGVENDLLDRIGQWALAQNFPTTFKRGA